MGHNCLLNIEQECETEGADSDITVGFYSLYIVMRLLFCLFYDREPSDVFEDHQYLGPNSEGPDNQSISFDTQLV